jgi:hypothetical protein
MFTARMALHEIVWVDRVGHVRVTDKRPQLGEHIVIDHVDWVVRHQTVAEMGDATSRFLLTKRPSTPTREGRVTVPARKFERFKVSS